jgi:hypothetical protein
MRGPRTVDTLMDLALQVLLELIKYPIALFFIFYFLFFNEEWIYETPRRLDNLLSNGKQLLKKKKKRE